MKNIRNRIVLALIIAATIMYFAVPRTLDTQELRAVSYYDPEMGTTKLDEDTAHAVLNTLDELTYRPCFPLFKKRPKDEDYTQGNATIVLLERGEGGDVELWMVYLYDKGHISFMNYAPPIRQYTVSDGAKLKTALLEILE